jgi:hypothetical protein
MDTVDKFLCRKNKAVVLCQGGVSLAGGVSVTSG